MVDIFKSIGGIFNIYCQSKDTADFLNLQGKLERPSFNSLIVKLAPMNT